MLFFSPISRFSQQDSAAQILFYLRFWLCKYLPAQFCAFACPRKYLQFPKTKSQRRKISRQSCFIFPALRRKSPTTGEQSAAPDRLQLHSFRSQAHFIHCASGGG